MKSDLNPPRTGLNADPVLYGVAAGLADLFPPVDQPGPHGRDRDRDRRRDDDDEEGD